MNSNKIEQFRREINELRSELVNSDRMVRDLTRILGAAKAQVTKLELHPIENNQKIDTAKKNLEIADRDYTNATQKYYTIVEKIRQKNIELTQEEATMQQVSNKFSQMRL